MPKALSDAVEQQSRSLFDGLEPEMTLRCRWQYLYGKIQTIQEGDGDVPDRMLRRFEKIEDQLKEEGVDIDSLRML